jgi:hypothetical protein
VLRHLFPGSPLLGEFLFHDQPLKRLPHILCAARPAVHVIVHTCRAVPAAQHPLFTVRVPAGRQQVLVLRPVASRARSTSTWTARVRHIVDIATPARRLRDGSCPGRTGERQGGRVPPTTTGHRGSAASTRPHRAVPGSAGSSLPQRHAGRHYRRLSRRESCRAPGNPLRTELSAEFNAAPRRKLNAWLKVLLDGDARTRPDHAPASMSTSGPSDRTWNAGR